MRQDARCVYCLSCLQTFPTGLRLYAHTLACPGAVIRNGTLQLPPNTLLRLTAPGVRFEGITIRGSGKGAVAGG